MTSKHDYANATADSGGLSPAVLRAFLHWWERLAAEDAAGLDKADRAVLRRCDTPTAVACTGAYQRAYRCMAAAHEGEPWTPWQQDRLAALVGLAAHIRTRGDHDLPTELRLPMEAPRVSELRFRRLIESPDVDTLFVGVRRVLPLIGHHVDLFSLARDLWRWNDQVRKRWTYAYYDTTAPRTRVAASSDA
ncbi:type I-E CRISPR-associated protein Cse2/CasB [uncultured Sphaerotilus sp.]|uniref:type I-E CRISPR-associated protein Cse2/CasB n=1 Tax=uncultured Sphaerotilus sp. TaxID=474984 RepID=UPI0030CA2CCD